MTSKAIKATKIQGITESERNRVGNKITVHKEMEDNDQHYT